MPDPNTGEQDKRNAPAGEGAAQAPADADKAVQRKFKSWEEAEKSADEAHATVTRLSQERSELQRMLAEEAQKRAELAEQRAAEMQQRGQSRERTPEEIAEEERKWEERLSGDEGAKAIIELNRLAVGMTKRELEEARKAMRDDLERMRAELAELRETSSDEYRQNKPTIERMMKEGGLTRSQAIKVLSVLPKSDAMPDRETQPMRTGMQSARMVEDRPKPRTLSTEERANARRMFPDLADKLETANA